MKDYLSFLLKDKFPFVKIYFTTTINSNSVHYSKLLTLIIFYVNKCFVTIIKVKTKGGPKFDYIALKGRPLLGTMSESTTVINTAHLPFTILQKYVVRSFKKKKTGMSIPQDIVTEINRENITAKSCVAKGNSGKTVIRILGNGVPADNIEMAKLDTGKKIPMITQRTDLEVEEKERSIFNEKNCKNLTGHHINSKVLSPLNSTRKEEPSKKYVHQDKCLSTDNISLGQWSEATKAKCVSDKICRICLKQGSISIFKNKDSKLAEAIMTIGGVDISENDNFPKYLCKFCHVLLVNAVLIREKARRSDKIFRTEEKNTMVSDKGLNDNDVSNHDENKMSIPENELCQKESPNHNVDNQLSNPERAFSEPSTSNNDEQDNGGSDISTSQEYFVIDRNMLKKHLEQTIDSLRQNYIQMKLSQTKSDIAETIKNGDSTNNGHTMESHKQSMVKIVKVFPEKSLESKSTQRIDDYFGDKDPTSLSRQKYIQTLTLICKDCELLFNSWRGYMQHNIEKHHERKKLPCPICQKDYSFSTIQRHVYYHKHNRQCEVCGKHFGETRAFNEHYKTHSMNFPYKCSSCPYRSRTERSIKMHMVQHTGEKQHKCPICPKKFINSGNLKRHIMHHKGERPHKCETCNQAFHIKSELKRHIQNVHFGIKRENTCNICGESFDSKKNCTEHKHQIHNMSKLPPYRLPHYLKYDLMKRDSEKKRQNS